MTSPEAKARQTAGLLANHLGLVAEVRADTGETGRSATGYVPAGRHKELTDRFFAEPARSADGWERAVDAQRRIVTALADLLTPTPGSGGVVVVGHGAVGTLLLCHLEGLEVSRVHDQPGQGHYWTLDRTTGRVRHRWRPVDRVTR